MTAQNDYSHLNGQDNLYIDSLYEDYKNDPNSVEETWRHFFKGFEFNLNASGGGDISEEILRKEFNVFRMIQSFRARGHLLSDTNPIKDRKDRDARISLSHYDLNEEDLKRVFLCGEFVGLGKTNLENIINHLESIYTRHIGVEYMHINNTDERRWFRETFESRAKDFKYSLAKKKRILEKLNEASVFESFLQSKYLAQKRFSLEGGESTIPALDAVINKGSELGAEEFVIGMAHRGRLNVLANVLGKTYEYIFKEFEGNKGEDEQGDGDVKYHMGFTSVKPTESGKEAILKIMPNPSHLEAVAPVVLGYCRAQADIGFEEDYSKVVPIMIHGDAAVAGQGVVYETLQMANLEAYRCGGAIHFVINNQIGFTTDWHDARSSIYCTSIAKTIDAPIIHVNGDDAEAVVLAMELAIEYRQKFQKEIFVDMVCYRKHGHNEGDEPKYTQPHLYGLIAKQKNPRELYVEQLLANGDVNKEEAKKLQDDFKKMLSDRFNNVKQQEVPKKVKGPHKEWLNLRFSRHDDFDESPDTKVKRSELEDIITKITSVPEGFKTLKKAQKILDERRKKFDTDQLDWATAELLAYGSLLKEGSHIRFSGQDVIRGTFSHRHAKVFDESTNEAYCALENISKDQGRMRIYNSHLSEYAVLGFEYGYATATPLGSNIWEAQFGDFSNSAQIIIDQFISSCESKWRRMCDLIMLLPHGYEGQGPEHSSCRPERYLQMCAEDNMIVANCTTPGNMFHVLRRQKAFEFRKPLIVFTPKSLLRDPLCISSVSDLTDRNFREVIGDEYVEASKVKTVLICSGKVYYDLYQHQQANDRKDVAIIRMEQLYPMPEKKIQAELEKYKGADLRWVQEEPMNMGSWTFLLRWPEIFGKFSCISRKSSASPATGYASQHKKEQEEILNKAFK